MSVNLNVIGGKGKGKTQGVLGVQVFLKGREFVFNYSTVLHPAEKHTNLLRDFRNEFIAKLELLNFELGHLKE